MKKLFYSLLMLSCIIMLSLIGNSTAYSQSTPEKGIKLSKVSYGAKPQIRIDDILLGNHTNGEINDDNRSKSFTMAVRLWIDKISEGELNYTNMPLFGITMDNYYGITTMADIILENGAYNVKMNTAAAGVGKTGDQHNKATARMEEWVFLALVVNDEEGWAKLYCDGIETSDVSYNGSGNVFRNGETAVFYCSNSMNYSSLDLRFDDLKIINQAMDASQIEELKYAYHKESLPEYINGYYTFDENTGVINEYANVAEEDVKAQVVEGTVNYTGADYNPAIASVDAMCDGWTPVYKDLETFTVNVNIEGEGSVILRDYEGNEYSSGASFMKDSTVTVIPVPGEDYILSEVIIDGTKQEDLENISFRIKQDTEINIVFILKGATVNIAGPELVGGTFICVNPEDNNEYPKDETNSHYIIPYNSVVKVSTSADEGYKLKSITVNSGDETIQLELGNPVFTIERDIYEINVEFVARFSVNYSATEGGMLVVKADGQEIFSGKIIDAGSKLEITVIPDEGYKCTELTVNGDQIDFIDNKFSMVLEENTEINAVFSELSSISTGTYNTAYYDRKNQKLHTGGKEVNVKLYSVNGNKLIETVTDIVDVNDLPQGIYLVIISKGGKEMSYKFVK